ncbi:MAG: phosphonate ABC transporter, permease protein PhnE [Planctomycetota bacterium]
MYLITGSFTGVGKDVQGLFGLSHKQTLLSLLPLSLVLGVLWSLRAALPGRMWSERTNTLLKGLVPDLPRPWLRMPSAWVVIAIGVLTLLVSVGITESSLRELFSSSGMAGARKILAALFTPDWSVLPEVLESMMQTIFMAFEATLIAVPIAFLASFPMARNLMAGSRLGMAIYGTLRTVFNFTRSIEPIIWAIIFSVWVGIGPFAGMLALMVHSVASLTKLYSEQVENIDSGPLEAMTATGARPVQVVWYAVVPQIVLPYLSFTIYRWDINVRMATIIGLVGGGGIGTILMQNQGLAKWNVVGTCVIVIALVVWLMDALSARVRAAIS